MKAKNRFKLELMDFSFLLPALLLFVFVILIPLISGIRYTFTDWDGLSAVQNFVGLKNYKTVFTDTDLIRPIGNTIQFTVVSMVFINVIGLALAMLVNHEFRGINVIKSIIFIPLVVSLVLVSQMWMYVYSDFFHLLGWESPLISTKHAMLGLSAMSIWRESGLAMIIYLAALKGVPSDVKEAAVMDGANAWQRFKNVTVPFIAPAFTYCIPLWMAGGLRQFDYTCVATGGGPGNASESIAYYIYKYLFPYSKVGYGQTVALIYLVVCIVLSNIVTRALRKREIEL
ncbi:MAG TPA: sugar ABC transporter permease [Candidatus Choladousia intestinigallinarum]|nr:sugar ABC transporter permease [Candidatus Choladousia intestinigallinarum]